ncbi:hypothetical protein AVO43_08690 [Microbulbifer sp. ZGT114]|nr:hypothetical protein AVO43_08690 [Microbulbifer sp. ZGT114]
MSYSFKAKKPPRENLHKIAQSQVFLATSELAELPDEKAVHQVRKRCKKMRALLRLIRYKADGLYRYENAQFRILANTLSGSRDAVSLRDALLKLAPAKYPQIEAFLVQRAEYKSDEQALEDATLQLQQAAQRIEEWPLRSLRWKHARKGYVKGYRRARKAMKEAFAEDSPERFHEFRKRVKDHWYQSRLLAERHRTRVGRRQKPLKKLAKALGDWRDLHLLCTFLAPKSDQFSGELIALLDCANSRSDELRQEIECLAGALFDSKRFEW